MRSQFKKAVFSRGFWLKLSPLICMASMSSWWGYVQVTDLIQVGQVRAGFDDVRAGDTQEEVNALLGEPIVAWPAGTGFLWRDHEKWIYGRRYDLSPQPPMLSWRIRLRKQRVFGPATGDDCVLFSEDGRVVRTTRFGDGK